MFVQSPLTVVVAVCGVGSLDSFSRRSNLGRVGLLSSAEVFGCGGPRVFLLVGICTLLVCRTLTSGEESGWSTLGISGFPGLDLELFGCCVRRRRNI